MASKGGNGGKLLELFADLGAVYGIRWVLSLGWKQVTGREPPTNAEDLHVGMGEAMAWAVMVGVGTEIARLLALRAAARSVRARQDAS
jgi:Protein of unknown function (DUF4235)